jgi:putative oxidoreductase
VNPNFERTAREVTHSLLRAVTGLMFWQHGAQKLFGWLGGEQVQAVASMPGLAGILEFFGGILIIVGLFTRPVAFILSGEMAFAYFMAHAPQGLWPIMNRGEAAVLFCFTFLFFAAHGAGRYSLDALLGRRRGEAGVVREGARA